MADYVNLNYTAAEINADLAKVHGVDVVVPEAPSDGKEYVRKSGSWVQNVKGVDTTIGDMLIDIISNGTCTQEQYDYLIATLPLDSSENGNSRFFTRSGIVYNIEAHIEENSDEKVISALIYGTYSIVGWIAYALAIKSDLTITIEQSMVAFGTASGLDISFAYGDKDASMSFINNGTGKKYLSDNGQYQELYGKAEIDSKIGDINTILDSINGEEV